MITQTELNKVSAELGAEIVEQQYFLKEKSVIHNLALNDRVFAGPFPTIADARRFATEKRTRCITVRRFLPVDGMKLKEIALKNGLDMAGVLGFFLSQEKYKLVRIQENTKICRDEMFKE